MDFFDLYSCFSRFYSTNFTQRLLVDRSGLILFEEINISPVAKQKVGEALSLTTERHAVHTKDCKIPLECYTNYAYLSRVP